uniref:Truncated proteinase inhibitor I n=1 Tax=Solanum tuberosum TaxID=4113 RepID=Q41496_SOLTU|nr:truncated proteinase inhibitor I [Solanum tuberosum]
MESKFAHIIVFFLLKKYSFKM